MKLLFTTLVFVLSASSLRAQTTATNWTATDCNSVSHTLFNELNSGKVVVFAWVMPCGSCVAPSKTAYNVVQSFASSHPGKVVFYMADDLGDANCSTLSNWVTSNNIGNTSNMTIFSNAGNVINENNFGGTGMPHIVVMGGSNHQIYFNKFNNSANDATGLQNAINAALGTTGIKESKELSFSVSPNPAKTQLAIACKTSVKQVTITSIDGKTVAAQAYEHGVRNPLLDISHLASGTYVVTISDVDDRTGIQKLIKE